MKNKAAFLTGLMIACTTLLYAEDLSTDSLKDSGQPVHAAPVVSRDTLWTNKVFLQPIEGHALTGSGFNGVNTVRAAARDLPAKDKGYQVITFTDAAAVTRTNRLFGTYSPDKTAQREAAIKRKAAWIQLIEATRMTRGLVSDRHETRPYPFTPTRPATAWHEWLSPRRFLPRWAEFWTTESEATPVVLVKLTF